MQQLILKNINVRQLGFERTTNRYKPKGTLSNNWRYLIQDYKWWNEDKRQLSFNL